MESKPTMQRRDFISQVAAGSAAVVAASGPLQALAGSATVDSRMARLTADDFAPFVGDQFELKGEDTQRVSARLVEATPIKSAGRRPKHLPRSQPFSLVFRTNSGNELVQETHAVRHRELGTLAMFLVPVGANQGGQRVEAVFN